MRLAGQNCLAFILLIFTYRAMQIRRLWSLLHRRMRLNNRNLGGKVMQIGDERARVLCWNSEPPGMNSLLLESGARAAIHIKEGRERGRASGIWEGGSGKRAKERASRPEFPSLSLRRPHLPDRKTNCRRRWRRRKPRNRRRERAGE